MEQMKIIPIDLCMPEKIKLAEIVQNELSTDFGEATVEWVDCPDLTESPFYLAEPGLCGDTALVDFGGISNLFPKPKREKKIYFKNILQDLNRTESNNFIIGGGLYQRKKSKKLSELITNASFSLKNDNLTILKNRSLLAHENKRNELSLKKINNMNPYCNIYGNFFISNGLREQVLKVQAKERFNRDFIDALQHAISRFPHKPSSELMGFGGTFIVRNGTTKHYVIKNWNWKRITSKEKIRQSIQYWDVQEPVTGLATFITADRHTVEVNTKFEEVFLTRRHTHSYSEVGGGYYRETELNNNTEYLGYFSPATKLYRINPVPMFQEMANFFCL